MNSGSGIAVIIPFYQRTPGILIRAVRSVFEQSGVSGFQIIVVDDGSPIPAREELAELGKEARERLVIVEQSNRGAAGARNRGLDSVPPNTEIVAFLDSDDVWTPNHLPNAMFALNQGFDLYFADFHQLGQSVTAFDRARRISTVEHPLIAGSSHVREYRGDMINQVITGNVLGTSVTVYAYSRMRDLRFREDFRHTGEEYLFWLDLALRSRKIAFSDLPECRYGAGVNIYSESEWGQQKYLTIIIDEVKYRRRILSEYRITDAQREFLEDRIRTLRRQFTAGLFHYMRKNRRVVDAVVLRQYAAVDKTYPLTIWPAALRILWDKLAARPKPPAA